MTDRLSFDAARALAGKSVAVIGVDRDFSGSIAAGLEGVRAEWRVLRSVASAEDLDPFDLVIADVGVVPAVASCRKPTLFIGPIEDMAAIDADCDHDFAVVPPLNVDELLVRLYHLMTRHREHPGRSTTPLVLAADDDPTTLAIVRALLGQAGIKCATASNGKQALERSRDLKPNAIVLDVNMPFLDGFEVLASLRNDPHTSSIPVVMLTSVQQEVDVLRGFSLGAADYVSKPFNPMELLARVQRLVQKS